MRNSRDLWEGNTILLKELPDRVQSALSMQEHISIRSVDAGKWLISSSTRESFVHFLSCSLKMIYRDVIEWEIYCIVVMRRS